eukprot:gene24131-30838_t
MGLANDKSLGLFGRGRGRGRGGNPLSIETETDDRSRSPLRVGIRPDSSAADKYRVRDDCRQMTEPSSPTALVISRQTNSPGGYEVVDMTSSASNKDLGMSLGGGGAGFGLKGPTSKHVVTQ